MHEPNRELTFDELTAGFRALGLEAGDAVIVHSSCKRMGHIRGGAETVIDALLEAIAPGGTLMLPTFNYTSQAPEPYLDPRTTPCRTGIINELGRQRPNAVRSLHPSHSVAAIGPDAEELTRDHLACRALGLGSPLDRLMKRRGKVLLINVGHTSNSMIHLAEEYAGMPKVRDRLPVFKVRLPDDRVIAHRLDTSPSHSGGFDAAEPVLRRHDALRDGDIGGALQLMRAGDVVGHVRALLDQCPDALLCDDPTCSSCSGTRRRLRELGRC
jgi:aminoglycoside 3-N-acetyltransferase